MTDFILIRHGEPDYSLVEEKNFKGHGCDLAFLSEKGIKQANEIAENPILKEANVLISSPYTRCMQTASIISNKTKLNITGEIELHEWLPDLSFNYQSSNFFKDNYKKAVREYECGGFGSDQYESIINVKLRVLETLKRYLEYSKVIVVTHGGVIYSLCTEQVPFCGLVNIQYDGKKLIKK